MRKYVLTFVVAILVIGVAIIGWARNNSFKEQSHEAVVENPPALAQQEDNQGEDNPSNVDPQDSGNSAGEASDNRDNGAGTDTSDNPNPGNGSADFVNTYDVEHTVADPISLQVLVNKTYRLPEGYVPPDLVYPDVPFIFKEKVDKRKMRKDAADALVQMFEGAKKDGVELAGVSGYRSEARQTTLYNNYVKKDGVEAADTYSARPGHSEHQTGLAIDVSGTSGKCAAESCFADTAEAKWLAEHAHEYGFVIRYPEDKESITGYKYEPWHIRYVGNKIADEVTSKHISLEEYFGNSVAVSK